jgi:tetratricopeptide (TPR) repeat protein
VRLRLAATDTELGLSLVRLQDFKGATEAYNEALKISEPAANSGNSGEDALYTTANAYAGMGEIEAGLASRTQNPDQERVRWRQAASWYERSLKMWARVKEPGVVSPEGFEPVPLPVVNGRFAECQGRIARLREHGHSE